MSHHKILVENLTFGYQSNQLQLDDITFSIGHGESIGLIGSNGAGKSTLLMLMLGLLFPKEGTVTIGDTLLTNKTAKVVQKAIGYVFQNADNQLFMPTVYDDIAFSPRNYGYSEDEVEKRVSEVLKRVNIEKLKDKAPYKLSGGEKKLVSIATILAIEPSIIFMDEPSNNLDPKSRRNLINLLKKFSHTKIIASHDLDMIYEVCDRVILLDDGKIVKDGNCKEILKDKELLETCNLELPLGFQKLD